MQDRLKAAAEMSQHLSPEQITEKLMITEPTLKRYIAHPKWEEFGGNPNLFEGRKSGRRKDAENDKIMVQAEELYPKCGYNWSRVAQKLGIPYTQLNSIRRMRSSRLK